MSNRIVHFEIPANEPEKIMEFYSNVFGWKMQKFGDFNYWSCNTGDEKEPGINGGIMKRQHADQPIVNTIKVVNLDEMMKKVSAAGGEIVVPKMVIPGVGWLSYFKDVEGNIMGIMEDDNSVK